MALVPQDQGQAIQRLCVEVDALRGQVAALIAYIAVAIPDQPDREINAIRTHAQQAPLVPLFPAGGPAPGLTANRTIDRIRAIAEAIAATRVAGG